VSEATDLHPRPQLRRKRWTDLNGTWGFAYDDADVGRMQGWQDRSDVFDRTCVVPYPPESICSGIADTGFHPYVWYRRTFTLDGDTGTSDGGRLLLHFGAVDYAAQVWINGQFVAQHEGGHTPFSADITEALKDGRGEQVLVVRAEDQPTDLSQPRGKQFWEPEPARIWYHRTTGIWQPVWLEPVAGTYIDEVRWTPWVDSGLLALNARLNKSPERMLRMRVRLSLRGDVLAEDVYSVQRQEVRREIGLEPAAANVGRRNLLWHPRHPNLVDAVLTLEDDNGRVLDEVHSYCGLRSSGYSDGYFMLNGLPYYLRLVLSQGYWPESHLAAPSGEAIKREVEMVRALGFNGVRIHQKVEDPRFLYWCDRLGVVVWGEMANAYAFTHQAVERLTREWMEVVTRDLSHPSIVTWVPINESWGVPNLARDPQQRDYVRTLYHLTKTLDQTRPVIGNDGWEHFASDFWSVHDYALDGDTIRERYGTFEAIDRLMSGVQPQHHPVALEGRRPAGEPVVLSECGGISYAPEPGKPWFGYGTVDSTEAYLAKYRELIDAILDCPTIAGFCYTQLTDTEQERNGLLAADRTPKLDPEEVRRITWRPSKAIPGDIISAVQEAGELTAFGVSGGSSEDP
jgi:beta-galactosidase/beta-glucuronidase